MAPGPVSGAGAVLRKTRGAVHVSAVRHCPFSVSMGVCCHELPIFRHHGSLLSCTAHCPSAWESAIVHCPLSVSMGVCYHALPIVRQHGEIANTKIHTLRDLLHVLLHNCFF